MKKQYFIIISIIVVALLVANVFFFIHIKKCNCTAKDTNIENNKKDVNSSCFVAKTLSLDESQAKQYDEIKRRNQSIALVFIDSLHVSQEVLMDYLASNENDPKVIEELEEKIITFQKKLLSQHVKQYQELKAILKPEQVEPMNNLFKSLFVCEPSCNHTHGCVAN